MTVRKNSANRASGHFVRAAGLIFLISIVSTPVHSQALPSKTPPANQDSLVIVNYEKQVQEYVKLRKNAAHGIPAVRSTDAPQQIKERQLLLASRIRTDRARAKRGDLFSPDVCRLFKQLIATAYQASDPAKVKASLRHDEPVREVPLQVNALYPEKVPLQTTPPSILLNLPPLPQDLEYRIVGQNLVLRDAAANLIVDFIPGVIPSA